MGRKATVVRITQRERDILERLGRASRTGQDLAVRARIVLLSAEGKRTRDQAMALRVHPERVSRWRVRWAAAAERLAAAGRAEASDKDLRALIVEILSDEPRPGGPAKFSAQQLTAIISLACENPLDSGRQVSHWTPRELAQEAIKRGIVDSISPRHVDRFLKGSRDQAAQKPYLAHLAG